MQYSTNNAMMLHGCIFKCMHVSMHLSLHSVSGHACMCSADASLITFLDPFLLSPTVIPFNSTCKHSCWTLHGLVLALQLLTHCPAPVSLQWCRKEYHQHFIFILYILQVTLPCKAPVASFPPLSCPHFVHFGCVRLLITIACHSMYICSLISSYHFLGLLIMLSNSFTLVVHSFNGPAYSYTALL